MFSLLILTAFTVAIASSLPWFDSHSDDDEPDDREPLPVGPIPDEDDGEEPGPVDPLPDDDGEEPEPAGPIMLEDGDTITGDDDADTYLAVREDGGYETYSVTLDAGGGDDTVDADLGMSTVLGGAGNDQLRVSGLDLVVDGGAGNDELTGTAYYTYSKYFGGDGDDHLSLVLGDGGISIDGGAGDDVITLQTPAGGSEYDNFYGGTITTGTGADFVTIAASPAYSTTEEGETYLGNYSPFVDITDFDPTEDMLGVEVTETPGRELHHIEVLQNDDSTDVVLFFNTPNPDYLQEETISLRGTTGLTVDDIFVLRVAA
jgi:Ca2+-binding RTX toxin-like protein